MQSFRFFLTFICLLSLFLVALPPVARSNIPPSGPTTIILRDRVIDTATDTSALSQAPSPEPQLWMLQLAGPVRDEWLDEVRRLNLTLVSYLPENAYVVWGDGAAIHALERLSADGGFVRWTGPFQPAYRLDPLLQAPRLQSDEALVPVTVQLYTTAAHDRSLARLRAFGGPVYRQPFDLLNLTTISLALPAGELEGIAAWPDVFNLEPFVVPEKLDERQGQLVAGNLTTRDGRTIPSGNGYLTWLSQQGFPTDPARYPLVDVVDDGIDQGDATQVLHPDFYELGDTSQPDRVAYITNCTTDLRGDSEAGHGNMNAGILAGYNTRTGTPFQDALGYQRGLGIAPFVRLGITKVFRNRGNDPYDISACGGNEVGVLARVVQGGANITSNSWGSDAGGRYTSMDQAYDILTRDASQSQPGNQQILHVLAAGNDGPSSGTISTPGSAKNVLSVGASEGFGDDGVSDGCSSSANNADDIASFSSRGPTADGRIKPDLIAPGTHIYGPATQMTSYNGSGICSTFFPTGQTLYTWSSGTSHAVPAVTGAAALLYEYYGRMLQPGRTPSPAMLKALLINGARYLNGAGSGDTLPSAVQGWGGVNLQPLFALTPRLLNDQQIVFGQSGEESVLNGTVADQREPVRITLVWTDAPGSAVSAAYVNNLNLEVTVGGLVYRGNVFNRGVSTTGGTFDVRNNVEQVTLPTGISGTVQVRIIAANIAGDGVPGNSDPTDQDFALVASNLRQNASTEAPALSLGEVRWNEALGNSNRAIDPGETIALNVDLLNVGGVAATDITTTLTQSSPTISLTGRTAIYPTIASGERVVSSTPYTLSIGLDQPCGEHVVFTQTIRTQQSSTTLTFTLLIGSAVAGPVQTFAYTEPVVPIIDTGVISVPLTITAGGIISDINVRVNLSHSAPTDLELFLIAPNGTSVELSSRNGNGGTGYPNTIFDDQATTAITQGNPPLTGSFQPEEPLSRLIGRALSGVWTLRVSDVLPADTGLVQEVALEIRPTAAICQPFAVVLPQEIWLPLVQH